MNSLKVVLLGNYSAYPFVEELGTTYRSIRRVTSWNETLAGALASLPGIEVHVITSYKGEKTIQVRRGRLTVTYLVIPKLCNALTLYGYTARMASLLIRTLEPDIVHGIGTEHIWPFVAVRSNYPSVVTIHGVVNEIVKKTHPPLFSRLRYFGLLEKRVINRTRHLIAISPYIQRMVEHNSSNRVYPVENAVSNRYFEVIASPSRSKTILFVGHTGKGKGLRTLVEAFAQLKRRKVAADWRIHVLGPVHEGNYYDGICQTIEAEKLQSDISFKGFLLPSEMTEEYRTAAFLVLPSKQESAPMCIAEAMACGIPVVATPVGGVPYMVADGLTGFLCSVNNNEILAYRMLEFMEHPAFRDRCGKQAKLDAERRWKPEKIASQTLQVYQDILDGQGLKN